MRGGRGDRGRPGRGPDPRDQRRFPGRREAPDKPAPPPPPSAKESFERWWASKEKLGHGQKVDAIEKEGKEFLAALAPAERDAFYKRLRQSMASNKAARARLDAYFQSFGG